MVKLSDMLSTLQRRHSFSATRGASTLTSREDEGNLTSSHKSSRFHRRLKSSAPIMGPEDTTEPSRARIMSLSGSEKRSKKEGGGGRSLMDLLKFKKRRKSLQDSKQHKTKVGLYYSCCRGSMQG